jgi:hypothetical protein
LLRGLATARQLIADSLAPGSRPRYLLGWRRWTNFCRKTAVAPFPASSHHVAACLATVASDFKSVSAVEGVYAAVAHFHRTQGVVPPTEDPAVGLLMRSVRRDYGRPQRSVKPLTPVMLRQMVDYLSDLDPRSR